MRDKFIYYQLVMRVIHKLTLAENPTSAEAKLLAFAANAGNSSQISGQFER
jgi:hypothetical protein